MKRALSILTLALLAGVLSASPASAAVPDLSCYISSVSQTSATITVSGDIAERTRIPLNMTRVENGVEEFVFLGTKRFGTGSSTRYTVAIPEGSSNGIFDFFARVRLDDGTKGARMLCGTAQLAPIDSAIAGNQPLPAGDPGCWVADYDNNDDGSVETFVSFTGDLGRSQNLRGNGRWITKLTADDRENGTVIRSTVDTMIIRGGPTAGTYDCVRDWTGDRAWIDNADLPFSNLSIEALHVLTFEGTDHLIWRQTNFDTAEQNCFRGCEFNELYSTNFDTGVATNIGGADRSAFASPQFQDCTGRYLATYVTSSDAGEASVYSVVDITTGESFGFFFGNDAGFDCENSHFIIRDLDFDLNRVVRLP